MSKRILFIGTVNISYNFLNCIIRNGGNIIGVITSKDNKINTDYHDLSLFCEQESIDCIKVYNINSKDSINWIKIRKPDIIFCFGWSRLLKDEVLRIAPMGVIGFHPASLPRNRGRHPLIWALALGLSSTSSTFFQMDQDADSGDIISQVDVKIMYEDDAAMLYRRISEVAQKQIIDILNMLENGSFKKTKQDISNANTWRKRTQVDGVIDWRMSSSAIYNLVRALSEPYVGAHFTYNETDYKVWSCKELNLEGINNFEPGKIIKSKSGNLIVKCADGAIELIKTEPCFSDFEAEYL